TLTASAPTCAWTAASNNGDWITLTSAPSGSGNATITFTAAANSGAARTGTLTIGGQTLTVNQAAAAPVPPVCTYQVSPPTQAVPAMGGAGSVTVTVSDPRCTWTAASGADWIAITSAATGTGNGVVTFSAAPNSGSDRSGTLTISGQTAIVTQSS